jgi:hypothetical protein
MIRFSRRWLLTALALTFAGGAVGFATVGGSAVELGLSEPGVAGDAAELHVALPLLNSGTGLASDVRVHRVSSSATRPLYAMGVSNVSLDRYGDYTAIRPHWPNSKLFSVSDYFLEQSPFFLIRHQYRLFGRSGDVGGTQ